MLAGVLLLHALFVLVLWQAMQPTFSPAATAAQVDNDQALVVRLIDTPRPPRTAPPVVPPPLPPTSTPPRQVAPPRVRPVTHEPPRHDAMVIQDHQPPPASTPVAVAPSGVSLQLQPAQTTYATTNPKLKPAKSADDSQIMQHDYNQMHTKSTRFEQYFPPPNESAGGKVGRHVGDALKAIAASICDPKSTKFNPLCGSPPVPPSPKDGDERLSLPSAPLSHDPNPPKLPSLASCFAEYRATRPLPYGCPLNTPDLAFNAEVRECVKLYRAGKRLQPWCPVDTARRAQDEPPAPATSASAGSH